MSVFIVTGRLGAGKSKGAVFKATEYARDGRRVAANFPIDLAPVSYRGGSKLARTYVHVIPPRFTVLDLRALGDGGPDEDRAGLLILDECGMFLNSRGWSGDGRQQIIDWLLESRKRRWDVYLLIQHQSMLDKQVREAMGEHLVVFRRLDKFRLPLIGWMLPKLPRMHVGQVRYGLGPHDPVVDHWAFKGQRLHLCYDTTWKPSEAPADTAAFCTLPPDLSKHRYEPPSIFAELRAWWRGEGRRARSVRPAARLAPLLKLPADMRWQAARELVARGVL